MKILTGDWKTGADIRLVYGWGKAKHMIFPDWAGQTEDVAFDQVVALEFSAPGSAGAHGKQTAEQVIRVVLVDRRAAVVAMSNRELDELVRWSKVRPTLPRQAGEHSQAEPAASPAPLPVVDKPRGGWVLKTLIGVLLVILIVLVLGGQAPQQSVSTEPSHPQGETPAKGVTAASVDDDKTKEEIWIARSQNGIKNHLKDPGSAQFRDVYFSRKGGAPVACGKVNSRNAMGGYTGYQRFVAAGEELAFLEEQVKVFQQVWKKYCGR